MPLANPLVHVRLNVVAASIQLVGKAMIVTTYERMTALSSWLMSLADHMAAFAHGRARTEDGSERYDGKNDCSGEKGVNAHFLCFLMRAFIFAEQGAGQS